MIDLRSGYFQILITPEHKYLIDFRTHSGYYVFLVMLFGLCNAPAAFQSLMNMVFREFLRKFVLVYFYDVLIYNTTWSTHLHRLESVLLLLRQHKLFAKQSKCHLGQTHIEYLGHIISKKRVSTDPDKIACMTQWPKPFTLKQLREFSGLTWYYRKFIKGYGLISKPLTILLKKDILKWRSELDLAFQQLKKAITSAPVLPLPDYTKTFLIETAASGKGIGAVLM